MISDEYYMAQAIHLAKKGWYSTHPNPRVGCVLVKNHQVIAQGWHQYAGQAHAEVNALAAIQAGDTAQGATAYVTLEPCSHFGKTPPCSDALIEAGIQRVVVAMVDPNPLVSGKGIKRLKDNGLEVVSGILHSEAEALNAGFIQRMKEQRPKIRCKMAMSLDGRTAMSNGESQWITSGDAREDVQRLRAESSAILTGIGTIIADDPSMNVRSEHYERMGRQPDKVILDSQLKCPLQSKILALSEQTSGQKSGQTLILTTQEAEQQKVQALESKGAEVQIVASEASDSSHGAVSLDAVMSVLTQRHYNDVLLEAGATLTGAMISAGFVDELIIYMAPHLMGSDARGLFNMPGMESMSQRIHLSIKDIRAVGCDYRITASIADTSCTQ